MDVVQAHFITSHYIFYLHLYFFVRINISFIYVVNATCVFNP